MVGYKKIRLMLTVVSVFMLSQLGWAQAANLRDVRTGKHEKFTRVVFEFQDNVLFENPTIKGKGRFSLVFLDSSTSLPNLTLFKTGPRQLVYSIQFVKQKSNLAANVQLSFPYFILKAFSLSDPNRVVVDVYQVVSPNEEFEQNESLSEKPLTETPTAPEEKELEKAKISQVITPPDMGKSEMRETQPHEIAVSNKTSNQITDEHPGSPNFDNKKSMTQIYLLAGLNVLTGVIVILMVFTLLKKKHMTNLDQLDEIMDFIKRSDEIIDTLDAQLKNAFKEYDES